MLNRAVQEGLMEKITFPFLQTPDAEKGSKLELQAEQHEQ